jgi:hypothetical protein
VKILLNAGADRRAKDKNGKTAWDYARESEIELKFESTKAYRSLKPKCIINPHKKPRRRFRKTRVNLFQTYV